MSTKTALAPIVKTRFAQRITRNGLTKSRECWAAETTDGLWDFEREDSPGTPWLVYHLPSCRDGSYAMPVHLTGTLRACREYVAAGHAQASLERLQAHERGEHNAARDSWCGRC
jgi:hypothetical protein